MEGRALQITFCCVAMLLSLPLFTSWQGSSHPLKSSSNIAPNRSHILQQINGNSIDGDLIFRSGRDMVSHIILSASRTSQFSHVGVILKQDGQTLVIHAMPSEEGKAGGVLIEPLETFSSEAVASRIGLYRDEKLSQENRKHIHAYLIEQKGKPFDNQFSLADDSAMYCTELAIKAYAAGNIDIATDATHHEIMTIPEPVITPDDLSTTQKLQPILHFSEADYLASD